MDQPKKIKRAPCLARSVPQVTWDSYVVEEPVDWEEYGDTQVSTGTSRVEPQPFRLKGYRTGQRVGGRPNHGDRRKKSARRDDIPVRLPAESYPATEGWPATPSSGADTSVC
jgi:hypothetical protein